MVHRSARLCDGDMDRTDRLVSTPPCGPGNAGDPNPPVAVTNSADACGELLSDRLANRTVDLKGRRVHPEESDLDLIGVTDDTTLKPFTRP